MPRDIHAPTSVRFSMSVYHFLLSFYPAAFRQEYAELMAQVFRDSCLQAQRQNHLAGMVLFWGRILADTFLSVIEQYANRGAVMSKSSWIKLSGWAMTASSFVIVAGFLASSRPTYNEYNAVSWPIDRYLNVFATPLTILGLLLIAFGVAGLKAYFGKSAGRLGQTGLNIGLIGIAMAVAGLIGQKFTDSSPWWEALMMGITALFVGLLIFGIRCIQRKLFSHWNALVLFASVIWPLVIAADILFSSIIASDFEVPEALNVVFILAAFTGVGLIGYMLQADAGKARSEPA